MITHAVIEAPKAVVQAIIVEKGDGTIRYRSEEAGMRPKLGRHSTIFNFTKEVKNICKMYHIYQAEKNACFEKFTLQTSSHSGRAGTM